MTLAQGNIVVYRSELCRIKNVGMYAPDGVNGREYCILTPLDSERSTYYVPTECAQDKLREPLTHDEALALIDKMRGAGGEFPTDSARRKVKQNEILLSGNYESVIKMAGAIYGEQERRRSVGKKLPAADERAMKAAQQMINSEFAYALGIEPGEVGQFIDKRLGIAE